MKDYEPMKNAKQQSIASVYEYVAKRSFFSSLNRFIIEKEEERKRKEKNEKER